jgi:hypothetical protein
MMNSGTEIINLEHASIAAPERTYQLQFVSTDKRILAPGQKTTLGYDQIGGTTAADKIGNSNGPIYRMEFVTIPAASFIKIWAWDNDDANAVVYPTDYLILNPHVEVLLHKFEWTDAAGTTVAAPVSYAIFGHRKRSTFVNV